MLSSAGVIFVDFTTFGKLLAKLDAYLGEVVAYLPTLDLACECRELDDLFFKRI